MTEHYPELETEIQKIDKEIDGANQVYFIKHLELQIKLEMLEQLRRIADYLGKRAVQ